MSVEVQNQGVNNFVNNNPANAPAGNAVGTPAQTPPQEQQVTKDLKDVDKNAVAQGTLQPDQGKKFSFTV